MELSRLAVLVTGNGTNCENIIRHFQNSDCARVELVVASRADAYALTRAEKLDVPTCIITREQLEVQHDFVRQTLQGFDYLILAGFLPKVPQYVIDLYPKRIINIHPALLPKFGGKGMWGHHVHEAVHAAKECETGITIHFVNAELDAGQHIAQFTTPLDEEDTPETIAEKVHRLEMKYFPHVIEQVVRKNLV